MKKHLFLFLGLIIFLSSIAFAQIVNPNGGFEEGEVGSGSDPIPGWNRAFSSGVETSISVTDSIAYEGSKCVKADIWMFLQTGDDWGIQLINERFPVTYGARYRYSIWAKASKDGPAVNFTVGDPNYQEYGRIGAQPLTTEWTQYTFDFTVNTTPDSGRAPIHMHLEERNRDYLPYLLFFDDLRIEKMPVMLSKSSINFGYVKDTDTKEDTVVINNIGLRPLDFELENSDPRFTFSRSTFSIEPSSSDTILVYFHPTDSIWFYDTVNVNFKIAGTDTIGLGSPFTIALRGKGMITEIEPPPTPILYTPANGTERRPINDTLRWSKCDRAVLYHIQVARDEEFTNIVINDTAFVAADTMRIVTALSYDTWYYWRVRAYNGGGSSAFSETFSFKTTIQIPSAPTLVYPDNNSTDIPLNVVLRWRKAARASNYQLQLLTGPNFNTLLLNDSSLTANDTVKQMTGLMLNVRYQWRVRAINYAGASGWTSRNFRTCTTLVAPVLISPENGATQQPTILTLQWHKSDSTGGYHCQVATDVGFGSGTLVVDDSTIINDTTKEISGLENNVTYYWRVRAYNLGSGAASNWTSAWSFTTSLTDVKDNELKPTEFSLKQNYPNPFNPQTWIKYEVPERTHVKIVVYDLLGNEIAILVNEEKPQGRYTIEWKPTSLSSGIYFYRMQAGKYSATKKLVFMK